MLASCAVAQQQHFVAEAGAARVVGDHHDGLAELALRVGEQVEDLLAGAHVDVAGGLVGQQHATAR